MDIFNRINQVILPGQRVTRVEGWEGLKKLKMPRDSEGIFLDSDPSKDYVYMKKVDINGTETCARYSLLDDPVEEFDPDKYVTKKELGMMKEEIVGGINSKLSEFMDAMAAKSEHAAPASSD